MVPSGLDFGIMCSGPEFDAWQADCIRTLREVEGVNLELLIIDKDHSPGTSGLTGKVSTTLGYRSKTTTKEALNKVAWWLYRTPFNNPQCMSKVNLSNEFTSVDRLPCHVKEERFSQYFHEDDIREIEDYDLDFVLRMGFGIIRGEILDVPRYGVWSFHHGDERKYRGSPACFWEIYHQDAVTGAILQRLTDRLDGGIILKRGLFDTKRTYRDNLNNVYYGTTEWPAQVAIDILNENADYIDQPPTESTAPIYRSPSPGQIGIYNLRKWHSLATTLFGGIDHWNIGVVQAPIEQSINEPFEPAIEWYPFPKQDGFLADPFPMTMGDTTYIFVEDFSYIEGKGKISYIDYPDGFRQGELKPAHDEPYHMSYPYLFKHNGAIYATPEVYEAKEIRLYQVHSPSDWEFKSTLIEGVECVDPTVIQHEDRWWMFYTEQPYDNTKLHVQYTDDLMGKWKPHENNPVKTDIRSSRPGGTPFTVDNALYRPAQNSAGEYGNKIIINKVENLTPTQYSERTVSEIGPSEEDPCIGMHTLSSRGELTLIDNKNRIRNRHALRRRLDQVMTKLAA